MIHHLLTEETTRKSLDEKYFVTEIRCDCNSISIGVSENELESKFFAARGRHDHLVNALMNGD